MRTRKLGALEVSELGFGILSFASTYGQAPEKGREQRPKSPHASFQTDSRRKSGRIASGCPAIASESYYQYCSKSGSGSMEHDPATRMTSP